MNAGESVTIPIDLADAEYLGVIAIELQYDPALLVPLGCKTDPSSMFDLSFCNLDYETDGVNPDAIRINAISVAGAFGGFSLATVSFEALGPSAAQTPLDIVVQSVSDIEGAPLPWVDEDGWVIIRESNVMIGDVNCDGEVNTIDAMFILQHDVGLRQASTQCPPQPDDLYVPNCDVRGDGRCDSADALFILQCDLGMPNSFCPTAAVALALEDVWTPQQDALLVVDVHTLYPDGQVTIPIHANILTGNLGAATVELRYDPQVLQPIACLADSADYFDLSLCNKDFDRDGIGADAVRLNALSVTGLTGEALLAEVIFHGVGPDGSASILELRANTFADIIGNSLDLAIDDGKAFLYSQRLYLPAQR